MVSYKINNYNTYDGKIVTQTADIDLSSVCGEDINGKEMSWVMIGPLENQFNGTFHGNGYTISGLYIVDVDITEIRERDSKDYFIIAAYLM